MKKLILMILLVLLGIGQMVALEYEYVPFVREGVKWVYYFRNSDVVYPPYPYLPVGTVPLTLEFKGDAEFNGKTYKAMHKYYGNSINVENDTIPIYMREEDKVVYAIIPDGKFYSDCPIGNYAPMDGTILYDDAIHEGREFILYDFNNPIDYWNNIVENSLDWYYDSYYLNMDTIEVGDHLAKRYVGQIISEFHMIEGIGIDGYYSYTLSFFMPMILGLGGPTFHLSHVVEDGNIIYKGLYYLPDIMTGLDEVVADHPREGAAALDPNYYNLMGQPVGTTLPSVPGIYIHHGNKILVR